MLGDSRVPVKKLMDLNLNFWGTLIALYCHGLLVIGHTYDTRLVDS